MRHVAVSKESFNVSPKVAGGIRRDSDDIRNKLIGRSPATFVNDRKERGLGSEALVSAIKTAPRAGMVKEAL